MPRLDIRGEICANDDKELLDWYGIESTCPKEVKDAIDATLPGETLDIYINSPGGEIFNGSDIYTMIREASASKDIKLHISGLAASAASIIAMSGFCDMSPTAMMMVHCVSTVTAGNHTDMEKSAETLRAADEALCSAYTAKSGMTKEDALNMMEHTTWLTAKEAFELGLVDSIMFGDTETPAYTNSFAGSSLTPEMRAKAKAALNKEPETIPEQILDDTKAKMFAYNKRKLELSVRKPI